MKPETIYICSLPTQEERQKNNWQKIIEAEQKLTALGIEFISPRLIYAEILPSEFSFKYFEMVCVAHMVLCSKVITLIDWYENQHSCKEVEIARIMDIPVVLEIRFFTNNQNKKH